MDIQTLFFAIAAASGVFGALLLLLDRRTSRDERLLWFAGGFLLVSAGVSLQYFREVLPVWLAVGVGNALAVTGVAFQAWAVLAVTGRLLGRKVLLAAALGPWLLTAGLLLLPTPWPKVVGALVYGTLLLVPGVTLLVWRDGGRAVRLLVGGLWTVDAVLYYVQAAESLSGGERILVFAQGDSGVPITTLLYVSLLVSVLITGFGVLILVKEQSDRALESTLAELAAILTAMPAGVVIVRKGRIERINAALAHMLGTDPAEVRGAPARILFPDDGTYDDLAGRMFGALDRSGHFSGEIELVSRSGRRTWTWVEARVADSPERVVVAVTDIDELKRLQGELARRADYDELTGLASRGHFMRRAVSEIHRSHRTLRPLTVMVFDVDRLKTINDTLGHAAGDQAIEQLAAACREAFREIDVVGRVGGDEFAGILPDSTAPQAAAAAERLLLTVQQSPLIVNDEWVDLGVSVGLAEVDMGESLDSALARADRAMYRAKTEGGARFRIAGRGDVGLNA